MELVVYFSLPAHGHVNPTLPVIRELTRRGQTVVYYSTREFADVIEKTGAFFRPYSAKFGMPNQGPGAFAQVSTTLELLLDLSCAVLADHISEVWRLRPTHIIYDSFAPWGRLVAQLLRLPSIASVPSILVNADIDSCYGAAPDIQPGDPRLTPHWYADFRLRSRAALLRYGIPDPPSPPQLLQTYGELNVVYTSRAFQPMAESFDGDRFKFVGPCFDFRPAPPPFAFERLDGRPLVLVSLGTVYGNRPHFFGKCLEELADTPWQIVLATGADFPMVRLGPIPGNFIVRPLVPQIEILRRCAAFVTHGGMNSVQEALFHGVPMVIAPQAADQFWISSRAGELGVAVELDQRPQPGAIRDGVNRALSCESYAAAAARIGGSLRAAGGAARAAREIETFIRRGGGLAARR